jgi:hypothetical protein
MVIASLRGILQSVLNCNLDLGNHSARSVAKKPDMAIGKAHSSVSLRTCNTTRPSCISTLEAGGGNDGGVVIVVLMTSSTEACLVCKCAHESTSISNLETKVYAGGTSDEIKAAQCALSALSTIVL